MNTLDKFKADLKAAVNDGDDAVAYFGTDVTNSGITVRACTRYGRRNYDVEVNWPALGATDAETARFFAAALTEACDAADWAREYLEFHGFAA